MKWTDEGWLARLVAGLILALCGDVLSPRAHACTNDYVRLTDHPDQPRPPAGCHGPTCSSQHPPPVLPESAPRFTHSELWGHWSRAVEPELPSPASWLRATVESPIPPPPLSIFHPPR